MPETPTFTAERVEAGESVDQVNRFFYDQGWGDGLPIIPPTEERVAAMVAGSGRAPQEDLGEVPPNYASATVEKIAINAVMAGCRPEYMPVLLAAVEASLDPRFNLYSLQATTGSPSVWIIVNGPVAQEIDVNSGHNCFGEGWQANATIGRAVRLIQRNLGGSLPGTTCKATLGWPGKYSTCIAENEAESPWEPLHVQRGLPRETGAVTVVSAHTYTRISDLDSTTGVNVLTTLGIGMRDHRSWAEAFLVLAPELALTIAQDGYSKDQARAFLWEKTAYDLRELSTEQAGQRMKRRPDIHTSLDALAHVTDHPEAVFLVVAGGAGPHSAYIPSWGQSTPDGGTTLAVTVAVRP